MVSTLPSAPVACPVARGGWRTARGVPTGAEDRNVDYIRRRAWGYPGKRWLRGRALLVGELERAGILVEPVALGCGSFGCAYPVEGRADLVAKITGDFSEAAAAQAVLRARGAGHAFPALVTYHCVYGVRGAPMFAILMERLEPLARAERGLIADLEAEFDVAGDARASPAAAARALADIEARAVAALGADGARRAAALVDTVRRLHAVGVRYHDLHRGNVLRDAAGEWRIIDLGVSVAPAGRVPRLGGILGAFAGDLRGWR